MSKNVQDWVPQLGDCIPLDDNEYEIKKILLIDLDDVSSLSPKHEFDQLLFVPHEENEKKVYACYCNIAN